MRGATKKVQREIEAAAVALGFPRKVSFSRVEREMKELDYKAERARFHAVTALYFLMDAARNLDRKIAKLEEDLSDRVARAREMVAQDLNTHLRKARRARWADASDEEKKQAASTASRAYWGALTPAQRSAEMKRRAKVRAKPQAARRGKK